MKKLMKLIYEYSFINIKLLISIIAIKIVFVNVIEILIYKEIIII